MRKIFNVNGKIFYTEKTFIKYVIKNSLTGKSFPCKKGIYSYLAYVGKAKRERRQYSFDNKNQVYYIRH